MSAAPSSDGAVSRQVRQLEIEVGRAGEQRFLAAEVAHHQRGIDRSARRDVAHGRALVAELREQLLRGLEDGRAGTLRLAGLARQITGFALRNQSFGNNVNIC